MKTKGYTTLKFENNKFCIKSIMIFD